VQALLDRLELIKHSRRFTLQIEQSALALLVMHVHHPTQIVGLDRYTKWVL